MRRFHLNFRLAKNYEHIYSCHFQEYLTKALLNRLFKENGIALKVLIVRQNFSSIETS